MGINTGAFLGQLVTGFLGELIGWHWGFGAAGVGMLIGLIWYAIAARPTLGTIGMEPSRHSDPAMQARRQRMGWLAVSAGMGILTLVVVLATLGVITIDPAAVGERFAYVLVGLAVLFFGYLFVAGGLTGDEKRRLVVIVVLFVAAAIF